MNQDAGELTTACWAATGGRAETMAGLEVTDWDAWLGGPRAVDGLSVGAIAAALLAAAELTEARGLSRPAVGLSAEHAALSVRSERHVRTSGVGAGAGFAPLSRILRRADGG